MDQGIYDQIESFLGPLYQTLPKNISKPFVTLTFAQSLDGKISKPGQQILLSGKESMAMTHRLRTLHHGIMVGIGTALIDDPQLNARYISSAIQITQPQPIIIDPYLKLSATCKLIKNYQNNTGKQVLLLVSNKGCIENPEKKALLESLGVNIIEISTSDDHLPLDLVLQVLKDRGIDSLMIEGGSKIIQSCLSSNLFDQLIITTAPMFIGSEGVPAITKIQDIKRLSNVKYITLGNDSVMSANQ